MQLDSSATVSVSPVPTRPGFEEVRAAQDRIRPHVHRTPVLTCQTLDKLTGGKLFFKCENFQRVGAFKIRGATNAVLTLTDEDAKRGVVTHSSGNHAAALSLAAKLRGVTAHIVMPSNSPLVKQDAVRGYGGQIALCEPTLESRESTTQQIMSKTGAVLIHPFNNEAIIAGQGTCAAEFMEDAGPFDILLAPVGGGGLLCGTAISAKGMAPATKVIGCEPEWADDAFRSMKSGSIQSVQRSDTIADGLRTSLGDKTFPIIQKLVDSIAVVSEDGIRSALRLILERMKIVIEPSSAVPLAAILEKKIDVKGKRVGIILSGGNLDFSKLPLK